MPERGTEGGGKEQAEPWRGQAWELPRRSRGRAKGIGSQGWAGWMTCDAGAARERPEGLLGSADSLTWARGGREHRGPKRQGGKGAQGPKGVLGGSRHRQLQEGFAPVSRFARKAANLKPLILR